VGNSHFDGLTEEVSMGDPCFKEDSEIVVNKVNFKYKQKDILKGDVNSFMLFNDIYLFCLITSRNKQRPKFRLDLTFFETKPTKSVSFAWKSLIAGVLFVLFSVFIPGDYTIPLSTPVDLSFLPVFVLTTIAGLILLLFAYYKSYSRLVFRSCVGRVPLLSLTHKPMQKNYRKFINILQKNINLAHKKNAITLHDRLVGEMKDLRRLKEAGVISEDFYNKAQSIILKNKHYQ